MFRKIILGIASLALIAVAFLIYIWREDTGATPTRTTGDAILHRSEAASQPGASTQPVFAYQSKGQSVRIPPGQAPKVRVYDPRTGEARIIFQAKEWNPISETEFHLTEPFARVLLPGGQLAYVRADQGQVKVADSDSRNVVPKSGWFKGHVEIFIDRTKPDWRQQHPEIAAPEQHPDAVVKIWLDDARFDLDLARMESNGSVIVQSPQGSIEGTGLELIWNESTRRLRKLRIVKGKRAVIRDTGMGEFSLLAGPSTAPAAPAVDEEETPEPSDDALRVFAQGQKTPDTPDAQPTAEELAEASTSAPSEISFIDQQQGRAKKDQLVTYELIFRDNIVARQLVGVKTVGSLKANVLKLLKDFGREERSAIEYGPGMGGDRKARRGGPATASAPTDAKTKSPERKPDSQSTIELTWTGEVLIEPITPPDTQEATDAPRKERRLHFRAEGSPVEMVDAKRGQITCRTFEYHMENKQGWLTGSPGEPLVMNAGPDRQVVVEDTLFFDQKNGEARITGPGRLVGSKRDRSTDEATTAPADALADASSEMQVAWKDSGRITFEQTQTTADKKTATPPQRSAYLKSAEFAGQVVAGLADQSIAADTLNVSFLPPAPKAADETKTTSPLFSGDLVGGTEPDHVTAIGHVHMSQHETRQNRQERARQQYRDATESVACDRLEIDMARDDTGRSYPRVGKAIGHVLAQQVTQPYMGKYKVGPPLVRDIRADDEITIHMDSVPRPPTDAEIQTLRAKAAQLHYDSDSPQWKKKEQELRNRRSLIRKKLVARGGVLAQDAQQDLNGLRGDTLECTFDDDQKIDKALLVGSDDAPAYLEQATFYIRGRQLSLDMATETVDVPGKGMLRFYSDQDIDGRPLDEKVPVVVTWDRQMWLRGDQNLGLFQGGVRVTSENNVMEAHELRLRFTPSVKPEADATASRPSDEWLVGPVLGLLRSRNRDRDGDSVAPQRDRRLSRADAFGEVVIVSSSYRPQTETIADRIDGFIDDRLPAFLRQPATRPVEPDKSFLLSRIRLTGPQVRIDLDEMQLLIEGAGTLLVEDYRIPAGGRERPESSDALFSSSVVPGVDSLGPSQTYFEWQNSMSFLSRDNIATFDHNVTMRHQAGTAMAMYDQLEAAMKLSPAVRKRLTNRSASLNCDNLVAQFETAQSRDRKDGSSPLSSATGLKAFWARRNIRLTDREARVQRAAEGSLIYYDGHSGDAKVTGTEHTPAWIEAIDSSTGRPLINWRGQEVTWNLKTGEIRTQKSQILAPGR